MGKNLRIRKGSLVEVSSERKNLLYVPSNRCVKPINFIGQTLKELIKKTQTQDTQGLYNK